MIILQMANMKLPGIPLADQVLDVSVDLEEKVAKETVQVLL